MLQAFSNRRNFKDLSEAEVLALAISAEEDDARIYASYAQQLRDEFEAQLQEEFDAAKSYKPNEADWFGGRWAGLNKPADPESAACLRPRPGSTPPG